MFDEWARQALRSGELITEVDVPKGIGPLTLEKSGHRFDPVVLGLLHRRQQSRALSEELYKLSETYSDPGLTVWRRSVREAMARGEYGEDSPTAALVRSELTPWQERWDAWHTKVDRESREEPAYREEPARSTRLIWQEPEVPPAPDQGFDF